MRPKVRACESCGYETRLIAHWGVKFVPCACPKNVDQEIDRALAILEKKLKSMGLGETA